MPFLKDRSKVKMSRSERLDIETSRHGLRHQIFNVLGDVYRGEWVYNKKEGKGSLRSRFDKLYEGDFLKNQRSGFGVLAFLLPEYNVFSLEYRGDWKYGHMHGHGLRIYPNGSFFIGQFRWSKRCGYGQLWNIDCSFYDGDWYKDKFHGEGMFINADGNRYEGEWQDGMKHGKGRFFHLDSGQMQEGVWDKDICVFSILLDIPYRQAAISPTKYTINNVELISADDLCEQQERMALAGLGNYCSVISMEVEEKAPAPME